MFALVADLPCLETCDLRFSCALPPACCVIAALLTKGTPITAKSKEVVMAAM
jgi:hypothetical protein